METTTQRPRVGLFVTCLVDMFRPQVGFAAIELLEQSGCDVVVPEQQTCCGQPAMNAGATDISAGLAKQVISHFEAFDYVVVPSGSCAAMIKVHFVEALAGDHDWTRRASALADKTWELLSFLTDVRGYTPQGVSLQTTATYHDSCSGLRELGISQQPRDLLKAVAGLDLKPLAGQDVCCGFGGMFCVKYADISTAIVGDKAEAVVETGADVLLGGDLGCLMNISGKLSRDGARVRILHTAEVLVGEGCKPGIGEAS